jgi:hypothetical protein
MDIKAGFTAHNRTVYAAPAVVGLASIRLGQSPAAPSHASLRHILPALVFASQSPYTGRQNVVNSRNVIRNFECPTICNLGRTDRNADSRWVMGTLPGIPTTSAGRINVCRSMMKSTSPART